MKNYINTRIARAKKFGVEHNFRPHDVLVSKSQIIQDKPNFIITQSGEIIEITKQNYKKIRKENQKEHNEKIKEFRKLYMEKRKKKDYHECGGVVECVFTFSEAIDKDLGNKYTTKELMEIGLITAKKIAESWGTDLVGDIVFHQDEKRGHFQFFIKDFDEKGNSLRYTKFNKKEDLSKIQDLAFSEFKKLGMERGISKELTNRNYQSQSVWNEKRLRQEVEFLKTLRDEISEAKKEKNLTLEQKKEIENDLKEIRTSLGILRKKADSTSENIVKDSKNGFGIFDSEKLKSKVSNAIYGALKINSNLKEVDVLQKENEVLKKQNETFLKEKEEVVEKAKKYIENGKKENVGLQKTIETQKTQIEKLETKVETLEEKVETINKNLKNVDFLNEKLNELKPTGQGDPLRGR